MVGEVNANGNSSILPPEPFSTVIGGKKTVLNSISLNTSRVRMSELFKDFKWLSMNDESSSRIENIDDPEAFPDTLRNINTIPREISKLRTKMISILDGDADESTAESIDIIKIKGNNNNQNDKAVALYVGDLDASITEEILHNHFKEFNSLLSVKICYGPNITGIKTPVGYGYVNFGSQQDADEAVEKLNYRKLGKSEIRIMPAIQGKNNLQSLGTNVFISNLNITSFPSLREFYERFKDFGKILSCKLDLRKRQGFIFFEDQQVAETFVTTMNESIVDGSEIFCSIHIPKSLRAKQPTLSNCGQDGNKYLASDINRTEKLQISPLHIKDDQSPILMENIYSEEITDKSNDSSIPYNRSKVDSTITSAALPSLPSETVAPPSSSFKQVYVKGLPIDTTDDEIRAIFESFGEIEDIYKENITKFKSTWSLITFQRESSAYDAIKGIHKTGYRGKKLTCVKALKKEDRQLQLSLRKQVGDPHSKGTTLVAKNDSILCDGKVKTFKLYLHNLPKNIDDSFFKVFLKPYKLKSDMIKFCINHPRVLHSYIEFEDMSDAKEVFAKLNGVSIFGHILQANVEEFNPTISNAFLVRKASFEKGEWPEKTKKKSYKYSSEKPSLVRSNSSISIASSTRPSLKPTKQLGLSSKLTLDNSTLTPIFPYKNDILYPRQAINDESRYRNNSNNHLLHVPQSPRKVLTPKMEVVKYGVSRSPSIISVRKSVFSRLEEKAKRNIDFLKFPSATRPKNLKRVLQHMIDTYWLNDLEAIKVNLDLMDVGNDAEQEFKKRLEEILTIFGFQR
ncbi:hypothetical protein WICMUC_004712 [Wickerhamomyces mucosus]|uniref:RRM domain-containing protein n=1 Tax=Wickerhamomyces mucosus TaxID=1378264 RepID=A0A9P8TAC4_9ASCO|nr:hypothetical protein WICMUC_004712 [Wickerhamomyces mucosus]